MSQQPPRLLLAKRQTVEQFNRRLRESLPTLAERLDALVADYDPQQPIGRVLGDRQEAREFVAAHPEVSGLVELDCQYVEVMLPSYAYGLLKAWPKAVFVKTNEDVSEAISLVRERF